MHPKHQRFVDEYLIDLDAKNAAIRAGFRRRAAHMTSYGLLRRPAISAAIAEAMAARARRTGITAERVLREYARLAFADPRDLTSLTAGGPVVREASELSDDAAAAIVELVALPKGNGVAVRCRLFDKESALASIARLAGLHDGTGHDGRHHNRVANPGAAAAPSPVAAPPVAAPPVA